MSQRIGSPFREPCRITVSQALSYCVAMSKAFGAAGKQRKKLNIRCSVSAEPMSVCDMQVAEAILAKLVARAYAADHPELFGPHLARALGGPADDK